MASRQAALPSEFAVFPLDGALLLPRGRLPLNIFEPRYLRMVDDALGGGRVIGMVQPDPVRGVTPTGPALYRTGCLGRITSFSETEDGRYLVTLTGLTRFWTGVELEVARGYRRVRADFARFVADVAPVDEEDGSEIDRKRLLAGLKSYFTAQGFDAKWDSINEMDDDALVTTLAMVCPFEASEKQALLEAPALRDRADALTALLEMGTYAGEPGDMGRAS